MDFLGGGTVEGITSRKDRSWKITIVTQELSPDKIAAIGRLQNEYIYIGLKLEPFSREDTEVMDSLKAEYEDKGKSPSKRLRGVLFYLFEKEPEGFTDFTTYYDSKMEKLIGHFKSKLDE